MIIGHLPAGYILSKSLYLRFGQQIAKYKKFMFWGMLGAIAPDFDMLYFYLIDHRQTHHHKYFTHFPISWGVLVVFSTTLLFLSKFRKKAAYYFLIFSISGFFHLFLDSIVGDIWWLAPFKYKPFSLATVHALHKIWWLNFIFHWSFLLELTVVLLAILRWLYAPNNSFKMKPSSVDLYQQT